VFWLLRFPRPQEVITPFSGGVNSSYHYGLWWQEFFGKFLMMANPFGDKHFGGQTKLFVA
jgi:hypothetical protein